MGEIDREKWDGLVSEMKQRKEKIVKIEKNKFERKKETIPKERGFKRSK